VHTSPELAPTVTRLVESARWRLEHADQAGPRAAELVVHARPHGMELFFRFLMPGLLALALLQLGMLGTAMPLLSAKERGVLKHWAVTPISPLVFFAAHVSLRLSVGALQVGLLWSAAHVLFGVSMVGHPFALIAFTALGAVMFISFGYALAGLLPRQSVGTPVIMTANFLMMSFGQVFVDLGRFPLGASLSSAMPVSYLADSFRQIVVGTPGTLPLLVNAAVMLAFTALASLVAVRRFSFFNDR
jgi:ABC-2 type transport system permease protein